MMEDRMEEKMEEKMSVISESIRELAGRLNSTVLHPLESIQQDLEKNWNDRAADSFKKRLALHREMIESVREHLDRLADILPVESDR